MSFYQSLASHLTRLNDGHHFMADWVLTFTDGVSEIQNSSILENTKMEWIHKSIKNNDNWQAYTTIQEI